MMALDALHFYSVVLFYRKMVLYHNCNKWACRIQHLFLIDYFVFLSVLFVICKLTRKPTISISIQYCAGALTQCNGARGYKIYKVWKESSKNNHVFQQQPWHCGKLSRWSKITYQTLHSPWEADAQNSRISFRDPLSSILLYSFLELRIWITGPRLYLAINQGVKSRSHDPLVPCFFPWKCLTSKQVFDTARCATVKTFTNFCAVYLSVKSPLYVIYRTVQLIKCEFQRHFSMALMF